MLHITVIGVGKIREKFFAAAVEEYAKRLGRYCRLTLTEVRDEPAPENLSPLQQTQILEREGQRILEKLKDGDYVTALCIEGKQMSSEALAQTLTDLANAGHSRLVFVIGGSMGLSQAVKNRANLKLSFSPMTFPHQLMRVILLEQLYRGMNFTSGGKYHK